MPVSVSEVINRTTPALYVPTLSNTDGVSGSTFFWWRDGLWLFIDGQITFNAVGASGNLTITLPGSGLTIDTSKLPGGTNAANSTASNMDAGSYWFNAGAGWFLIRAKFVDTTHIGFWTGTQAFNNDIAADGDSLNLRIKAPIVGWG